MAVILAVTIGAMFLGPVATTVADSTGTQVVTNETVTADTSQYVEVDGYELVDGTVTVYGYNDTSGSYEQATEGTDYSVKLEPGSIQANSSSTLIQDGEDVKVSYDYEATTGTQTLVAGFITTLFITLLIAILGMEVADRV
jgi:hypothetical protein